jgi:ACS family hexuronate transporter-like MFS transporter
MDFPKQALPGFRNYRWVICALLFFATTINYMDRQIHSLTEPILDKLLKWTNTQHGCVNSWLSL